MSFRDDYGYAVVESVVLGVVLILPMVWLLSVLSTVHSAALATNSAVREAGAVVATSLAAPTDLEVVARDALRNHGLDPAASKLVIDAPEGFTRGAAVHIALAYAVPLFDLPLLDGEIGPALTVRSRHVARVDPYRSR